jgi:hypothetical protein
MVRLQHKHRRDGVILVGGGQYALDAEGCVEVPEEAAAKLKQGALWGEPGSWPRSSPAIVAPPSVGGARRPRTREELAALAEAEGLPSPSPSPMPPASIVEPAAEAVKATGAKRGPKSKPPVKYEPKPPPAPPEEPEEPEPEEGVIRISRDTPKDDLVRVAKQLGLEIPKYANQEMVFELIKKAHGERT